MRTFCLLLLCGFPAVCYSQTFPGGDCFVQIEIDCTDLYPDYGACSAKNCVTRNMQTTCEQDYTQHTWDTGTFPSRETAFFGVSGYSGWQESWGEECSYHGKCWCDDPEQEDCRLIEVGEWWDPTYFYEIHWEPVGPPFITCVGS